MPYYSKLGQLPKKRHIQFRRPDGALYSEEVFGTEGFVGPTSTLYHMPPPTHQTFSGPNFVLCSFVPRLFDFHPEAIPAPYNHSNVNSDEVIYYAEGEFMSRTGIDRCDISMHPFGLPHGPQPGATEASIGKKETNELAVMVDTFYPLHLTAEALELEKEDYQASWSQGDPE